MSRSALFILMAAAMAGIALGSSPGVSSCMTNGSCNAQCICIGEANCTQSCNCLNTTSGSCSCAGIGCMPFVTSCTNNSCSLIGAGAEGSTPGINSGDGASKKPPVLGRCPFESL